MSDSKLDNNDGNEEIKDSNLEAISINLLYNGLKVQGDVYDADATRLLIRSGSTLNDDSLRALQSMNEGRNTLYVTQHAYRSMFENTPPEDAPSLQELEETTGYGEAAEETGEILDEIVANKSVQKEAMHTVSSELSNKLEVTSQSTIMSLINALAPVDKYLQRHCVDVSLLNGLIGRWLGLPKTEIDNLVLIGLLHDCGKALIPPKVLNAARRLTVVEFEVIKMHALHTYDLLTEFPEGVRRSARGHHEKVSGAGYPDHLSKENLSLEARVTAVSDIYDAMVSQRAYKTPRSPFNVLATLVELKGLELDSDLVDTFINNMPGELIDKPVVMSDGSFGVIRSYDPEDIEFPMVEVNGRVIKSGKNLFCTCMYTGD